MNFADFARAVFALVLTLGLVGLAAVALRRFGPDAIGRLIPNRKDRRLAVVETLVLDPARRLVLVSCETEGNYPPGLAGRAAALSAKLPGGLSLMRRTLLSPRLRRLPMIYGQMSKRGVPDRLLREWLEPLARPEIRRDLRKYVGDVRQGRRDIRAATPALRSFDRPVLVVWDSEGPMMPGAEGRRLAESFPDSRYVKIPDCYTLIPIDQPQRLAAEIAAFAA